LVIFFFSSFQSNYNTPAQKYPANVSAVALSSLSTGWKPLSVPAHCSQKQTVPIAHSQTVSSQAHIPEEDYNKQLESRQQSRIHPSSNHIKNSNASDSKTAMQSNKVTFIHKYKAETIKLSQNFQPNYVSSTQLNKNANINHKEELIVSSRTSNCKEGSSIFLTSPQSQWCKREENGPKMGIDVMGSAAEPMQSAAQARATKWAPRPTQSVQIKSLVTNELSKPLYVPVFKKNKTGWFYCFVVHNNT
jgi:hypothetical protein